MILFFSKFLDFYKKFSSTFLWNRLKPKQTLCIPKHLLKDDWMFLQHWATCWCRRPSVGQTISVAGVSPHVLIIRHQLAANKRRLPWSPRPRRGNMWCNVLYIADLFRLHGNIRPGNKTISLFFCVLNFFFDFFVFLVTISRLNSFI